MPLSLRSRLIIRLDECQTKSCTERKAADKNYCASRNSPHISVIRRELTVLDCCTIETCADERQGEPLGSLCLERMSLLSSIQFPPSSKKSWSEDANHITDYNEKIGADAIKNAEKEAEKAEKEAKKAAEKRRKKKEEEVLSEQSREDRRRKRFETSPSGSSGVSYHSPPRSRGSDRPRVTREKKYYYEDDWEDDEAYRSSSSTGPGDRYAGFARRRASSSGLRDEYIRAAYGRGSHKAGW
jgi:hypothetical protein